MRKMQKNLMFTIVAGIVIATLISGGISLLSYTAIGKNRSNEVLQKELEIRASYLNYLCEDVEDTVLAMGEVFRETMPEVNNILEPQGYAYIEDAKQLAKTMVSYNDNICAVYYRLNPEISTSKSGFFLSKTSRNSEIEDCEPTDLSLYRPTDAEHVAWFYEPIAAGGPTWVSQYMNLNNGLLTISYCEPIYAKNGTFVGVVGVDIDMMKMYESISDVKFYDSGFAALMSRHGSIQYSSQEMFLSSDTRNEIIGTDSSVTSFVQRQRRMTLMAEKLQYGDYLLIAIADEDLYMDENRVVFSIVLISLSVSVIVTAALTGLLSNMFYRFRTDSLSGTRNRPAYMDTLAILDEDIRLRKTHFTVLVFDINGLKYTNDHVGHSAGDELIKASAEAIKTFFPHEDIYRIGGDEFVIISRKNTTASLTFAYRKFKQAMDERGATHTLGDCTAIVSAGISSFDEATDNCYDDVFQRADHMMYENKAQFYTANPKLDRRIPKDSL